MELRGSITSTTFNKNLNVFYTTFTLENGKEYKTNIPLKDIEKYYFDIYTENEIINITKKYNNLT
jgi:hypothetical protein